MGGDWYDVLALPDGRLAVVVGDVAGHGMAAASTMGQLRNGLRALLVRDPSVSAAASWLDQLAKQTMPGEMATLIIAVVDPVTGVMDYVRAGHFPPLILSGDGTADWPTPVGTMPIGFARQEPIPGRVELEPGGGVLLFTDGLIEHRGSPLPQGMDALRTAFSGSGETDLDVLIAQVRDPSSDDDATAVVLRRH